MPFSPPQTPDEKAKALLASYLTPAQREMYDRYQFFVMRGQDKGVFALIGGAYIFPILGRRLDIGRSYGISTHWAYTPLADRLLAQKLMLETHISTLKEACRGVGQPPPVLREHVKICCQQLLHEEKELELQPVSRPLRWWRWWDNL